MKQRFLEQFEIVRMTKSCLCVQDKKSGEIAYIHRHAFNSLDICVDFRIIQRDGNGKLSNWVEVLVWKCI